MYFFTDNPDLNLKKALQWTTIFWFTLAMIAVVVEFYRGSINNYLIFKNVYWHTVHQTNLYSYYPREYFDLNHYGPLFSLLIFPFAMLPDWLGVFLWALVNAGVLYYAIRRLPVSDRDKCGILLICSVEMMTSVHNLQFNPMLTGWVILIFVNILNDKTSLACALIAAGFLIKIYGIAALLFFFFSREKGKFVRLFCFWFFLFLLLPMVISSPAFIAQTYVDWYHALVDKNELNVQLTSYGIDISVMGMIRRIFRIENLSNITVLLPAVLAITYPLTKSRFYDSLNAKLSYLALVLISIVIFSSSAESPTYIIAVTGVAIWYTTGSGEKSFSDTLMLVLVLIITCLSTTDLFPRYVKTNWIKPFSLKALPCFMVWILLLSRILYTKPAPVSEMQRG